MESFDGVLARLEELLADIEALDEPARSQVFELLDGIDAVHRRALGRLADSLGQDTLAGLRGTDPLIAWLLDAYGVGVDEHAVADAALEEIRPYIASHGGRVDVLDVAGGVVRLRLSGACSGCTASAVTLQEGVERSLRDGFPGFARMEVEEDSAEPHPPPTGSLLPMYKAP